MREPEDEQAQNVQDAQRRRSNRARRSTARAQAASTDIESGIGFAAVASSLPLQRTSSPPRQTRSHDLSAPPATDGQGKRGRSAGDDGEDDGDASRRPPKRSRHDSPTVSFEEVYGNGRPEYRHAIVEYPQDSGNWFILRCDECGLHFKRNALQGGAKHLNGANHGWLPRDRALAVQEFGFRVLGCDKEKAKRNNDAFDRAIEAGYVPRKRHIDQAQGQHQESIEPWDEDHDQQRETDQDPPIIKTDLQGRRQRGKPFEGITDPTVGRLYRVWYRGKGFYAALMLPLGSFGTVGVVGDISNIDQQDKAPICYRRSGERILRWASGYEDGGPKFRGRKFPMMYFEDSVDLSFEDNLVIPPSLGWVAAKNLRPFDVVDPECQRTRGFKNAQIWLGRARILSATMLGGTSAGEESDKSSG